jgi:hypothetical protein
MTRDIELSTIEVAFRSAGQHWPGIGLYIDLFQWSYDALRPLRSERLEGADAITGRRLYSRLFSAYQYLRQMERGGERIDPDRQVGSKHGRMLTRYIHGQLPDCAPAIIKDAWLLSIDLGCPDPELINNYVRMVAFDDNGRIRASKEDEDFILGALSIALDARPEIAESIYLLGRMTLVSSTARESLAIRVARVNIGNGQGPERAYLHHARAFTSCDDAARATDLNLAAASYHRFARVNGWNFDRVRDDWRLACAELQRMGDARASQRNRDRQHVARSIANGRLH